MEESPKELGDLRGVEQQEIMTLLTQLKVMTRKKSQRVALGEQYMGELIRCLQDKSLPAQVAAEGANVILNLCYERQNVELIFQNNGAAILIDMLASTEDELQANAAGALQSISFHPKGRQIVRALGAISTLCQLLSSKSPSVRARAAGALHNISSDGDAIREIRKQGGIKSLIRLLQSRQQSICGSAAGALQNISREIASRKMIRNSDAIFSLVHLLASPELQTQVCAAGALLNLVARESHSSGNKKRTSIVRAMRNIVLTSIVHNLLFTPDVRSTFASIEQQTKDIQFHTLT